MSRAASPGLFATPPPPAAIEISSARVNAVALSSHGSVTITGHSIEPLPAGLVTPALNAINVHDQSALAGAIFRPRQQSTKPEDVQQSVSIAASDRVVIYGQFQATGNWIFGDSKAGSLHKVLAVCEGKLVTVLNLKIDDNIITRDSGGVVTSAPYNGKALFQYRAGLPTETYFSGLASFFPEWTSAHR